MKVLTFDSEAIEVGELDSLSSSSPLYCKGYRRTVNKHDYENFKMINLILTSLINHSFNQLDVVIIEHLLWARPCGAEETLAVNKVKTFKKNFCSYRVSIPALWILTGGNSQ